jgi:two-component system, NarL family, response regulator NreC
VTVAMSTFGQPRASPHDGPRGTVRIAIADDHRIVRSGLRLLLDRETDFEVVAEAGDVDSARRCVRGHHPDILLLDLNMPGGSALQAIPALRAEFPKTQIVVLTMEDQPAFVRDAFRSGALGYVVKDAAAGELVSAIRLAAKGTSYLNPQLGARVAREPARSWPDGLSDRDVRILRQLALGHSNNDVATQLHVSARTLESHRQRIQKKLGITRRRELVGYARSHGLLDED